MPKQKAQKDILHSVHHSADSLPDRQAGQDKKKAEKNIKTNTRNDRYKHTGCIFRCGVYGGVLDKMARVRATLSPRRYLHKSQSSRQKAQQVTRLPLPVCEHTTRQTPRHRATACSSHAAPPTQNSIGIYQKDFTLSPETLDIFIRAQNGWPLRAFSTKVKEKAELLWATHMLRHSLHGRMIIFLFGGTA